MWGVRNAVALSFPLVVKITPIVMHKELSQYYEILLEDQSRWVVFTASKNFAEVLSYLEYFNENLFQKFLTILDKNITDFEVIYKTAFNFPGVLFQLNRHCGHPRWHEIK